MPVLSIIIPVYNEIETIDAVLARVRGVVLPKGIKKQIIVVDDSSTDGTKEILAARQDIDIMLFQPKNLGKGAAVRRGIQTAAGDFVVIQDADLEYDPADYSILLAPLLDGTADVVYGSRFINGLRGLMTPWWHYTINKMLTFMSNVFTGLSLTDMETCYKMLSKKVCEKIGRSLVSNRFEIEPELTARIAKAGFRIKEVAVSYRYRPFGKGKKIGWKDGLYALWAIIRFNIFSR